VSVSVIVKAMEGITSYLDDISWSFGWQIDVLSSLFAASQSSAGI
jgi:hypothetical protein